MFKRPETDQKGAAAVEMAIVSPILILMVFGAMEMGLMLYNKQVITNASREGARAAIVSDVPTNPEGTALDYCNSRLINLVDHNGQAPVVGVADIEGGAFKRVSVSYTYRYLFASLLGFSETHLTAQTTMRAE